MLPILPYFCEPHRVFLLPPGLSMIDILPTEIIEHMLTLCAPRDVASFAQTCRLARLVIYKSSDHHLWRELFLAAQFDDLRSSPNLSPEHRVDWQAELKDRVEAELILGGSDVADNVREDALAVVLRAIHQALPAGPTMSASIAWAQRVLKPHFESIATSGSSSQNLAQVLAYSGLTHSNPSDAADGLRTKSRAYVYDLRHYTIESNYGVFQTRKTVADTRVYEPNWVHIQYCVNDILMNVFDLTPGHVLPPRGLEATRAYSAPESDSRADNDWAGVEGVWRRYVCFMDYRDLHSFNFSQLTYPCDPSFFEVDDFFEATRLIEMEMRIMEPGDIAMDLSQIPNPPADKNFPRLYVIGFSRGHFGQQALVKGHVDKHADGTIQWTLVSIYDHQTKWLFDGVQLGNVCSAAGVVGSWTGANHEPDDPNGPSWVWKVSGRKGLGDILRIP